MVGHYPPKTEFLADYAEYCRRLAAKTKGWYTPEFEIWNEPNNEPYGSFKGTFEEFVAINRTAADAIHAVNPEARMILGTTGDADCGYIARLLKAGLADKFQIVDIHPYRHTSQGPEDGLDVDIRRPKKVIELYGRKQGIIFSEVGWPTYAGGNPGYGPVTLYQQACYFARTMFISMAMGVERVHVHILTDWKTTPNDPEGNFGLIDADARPKPSLCALANTARHLEQAKFLGVLAGLPGFHHAWVWQTPWMKGANVVTIWCDTAMTGGKTKWVALPGEPLMAEDLWGDAPGKRRLRHVGGKWEMLPGEDPIFVYVAAKDTPAKLEPLPTALRPWHLRRLDVLSVKDRTISVDGELSDWGELAATIGLDRRNGSATMGFAGIGQAGKVREQNTSRFGVGYSDEGLLIGIHVKSGRPMKNDASFWWIWQGDCVRVYLSTLDRQAVPFFSDDHFQFGLAPVTGGNGPAQAVHISYATPRGVKAGALIPGAKVAARNVPDGWTLEALIPWSYFGRMPKCGDIWSFDLEAAGSCWNGSASNWHDPTRWGTIQFKPF